MEPLRLEPGEPIAALLARLETSARGLSTVEAERRFRGGGPTRSPPAGCGRRCSSSSDPVANPLVVILLAAGTASAFVGEVVDAAIIVVIVLLSVGLNFVADLCARRAPSKRLRDRSRRRRRCSATAPGSSCRAARIVAGDVIRLSRGRPRARRRATARGARPARPAGGADRRVVAGREARHAAGPRRRRAPSLPTRLPRHLGRQRHGDRGRRSRPARDTAFGDIVARLAARPPETEFERGMRRFGLLILQTVIFLVLFILIVNVSLGRDPLPVAAVRGRARGRAHARVPADDHHRHARAGRDPHGAREGDREAPAGDPEPRQHRRPVQRQDRDAHGRHDDARRVARSARREPSERRARWSHAQQPVRDRHQAARSTPRSSSAPVADADGFTQDRRDAVRLRAAPPVGRRRAGAAATCSSPRARPRACSPSARPYEVDGGERPARSTSDAAARCRETFRAAERRGLSRARGRPPRRRRALRATRRPTSASSTLVGFLDVRRSPRSTGVGDVARARCARDGVRREDPHRRQRAREPPRLRAGRARRAAASSSAATLERMNDARAGARRRADHRVRARLARAEEPDHPRAQGPRPRGRASSATASTTRRRSTPPTSASRSPARSTSPRTPPTSSCSSAASTSARRHPRGPPRRSATS